MSQISRLKDAEISNGNLINADDLDAEFNELYSESNAQDLRLEDLESNDMTIAGVKTFNSAPKTNQIDERSSGSGVTIDSVLLKDGTIKVPGSAGYTPTANGEIGYDSTSHTYDIYVNGVARYLLHDGNIGYPKGYIHGLPPIYASAATVTFPSGLKARNSTNTADIELAANVTVTLASVWVVATPGLDAGAEAADTWYYFYLIKRSDTGVTSVIASTVNEADSGSITLPTDYDLKRQLPFAVRNDASSNIIPFYVESGWPQRPKIMFDVGFNDARSVVTGMPTNVLQAAVGAAVTTVTCSSYIPPFAAIGVFHFDSQAPSAGGTLQMRPTGRTDFISYGYTTGVYNSGLHPLGVLNSSKQVDVKSTGGNTGVTALSVAGFIVTGVQ